ncbi:MAG: hypothetical protein ACXV79_13830 [Methylobacter sp.]
MDIVDTKLILLSEAIKNLTTDRKLYKKLHYDYQYKARKEGLTLTNNKTEHYQVDAKQFYDWVKLKFPDLKANIPEEYRLTQFIASGSAQYALNAFASTPTFSTLSEAKQIIQDQADEIRDLKNMLEDLTRKHEQAFAEVKIKADKWDRWIGNKRRSRFKYFVGKIN